MGETDGHPDAAAEEIADFDPPAPNERTLVCGHVAQGAPLAFVGRDEDGDLQALCEESDHTDGAGAQLICWAHVRALDEGLVTIEEHLVRSGAGYERTADGWTQAPP